MMHDFDELNSLFNAETWLIENFGCEFYPTKSGWLNTCCPFEDHIDSNPSFGINMEKCFFQCFGCGKKGSFIKMVSLIQNIPFIQAAHIVAKYTGIGIESIDSIDFKHEKFKKTLIELDDTMTKNKRIAQKATLKIKKQMIENFEEADLMYKKLDDLINLVDYNKIKEIFI